MGLFGYKKLLHPGRTVRRAATRPLKPKPLRKAMRAGTSVRHPASSLEGAAKASLSRSLSSRSRRGSRSGNPGVLATAFVVALAVLLFVAPGVVVMMLITGHYFMATLGSEFWQSAGIAAAWWVAVAVSASARSAPFAALVVAASTVVALIAFSNASPSTTTASANSPKSHRVATTAPGCRLYMAGANVRIAVSEQKRCAAVTRHLRAWTGEHWIHRFHSTDDTLTSACELRKGALRVRVFDSGFQTYGDEACHALRHHGFTRIGT